jgi:hypothetical protein
MIERIQDLGTESVQIRPNNIENAMNTKVDRSVSNCLINEIVTFRTRAGRYLRGGNEDMNGLQLASEIS